MPESTIISAPANFDNTPVIEKFYRQILSAIENETCFELSLDFRQVNFFTPEAVLNLICSARLWQRYKNSQVKLILQSESQNYFERINLFQVCNNYFSLVPQSPSISATRYNRSPDNRTLLEISSISSNLEENATDLYHFSGQARNILTSWELERVTPILTLLHEVIENITHSNDKGFVFMQRHQDRASGGSRIQLGIADLGIGIETSLQTKYPNLGAGSVYLSRAICAGVTARTDSAGLGMHNVQKIVREGLGKLIIRSNSSMLQVYGGRSYSYDNLAHLPGTQVYITILAKHFDWQQLLPTS